MLTARDGTERPFDDSAAMIRDATGEMAGVVIVFRDVAERRHTERELRQQHELFKVTLESIGDAVIATDVNGRVTFLNAVAEQLTGWKQQHARDITARKWHEQTTRFLAEANNALAAVVDDHSTLQKVARLAVPFFADWCAVDMLDERTIA